MFKRLALGLALVILSLGTIFIGLDILDIAEGYRLYLSIPVFDTVFICIVAVLVVYIATKTFMSSGSLEIMGLSCAVLAFGLGSLLHAWLRDPGFNTRITANDTGILIAAVMHLYGAVSGIVKRRPIKSEPGPKQRIFFFPYLGILLTIVLITWLASQGLIISFIKPLTPDIEVRDVIEGVAAILCVASALIYFRTYFKSHSDFYYWYSLGLILFTAGFLFISRGALESKIGWLGRASEYVGGIYFLVAVLEAHRQANDMLYSRHVNSSG